jgi:hypothetical protein
MGLIYCPETSVRNYFCMLRNIQEKSTDLKLRLRFYEVVLLNCWSSILLSVYSRYGWLLLHLTPGHNQCDTHTHTHTYSVGLLWTSDQPVAETST